MNEDPPTNNQYTKMNKEWRGRRNGGERYGRGGGKKGRKKNEGGGGGGAGFVKEEM
jgi:hypothetical protein